ncbi:MAG: glutamyl-tRNA reductase [Crenarchaeota archaeon]|nr:glutamyl-tRNA reductase [Thermoproteota archaeon]MDA1124110.1 glutamyl-tRNA reductase [Thermoproteota archaeon]
MDKLKFDVLNARVTFKNVPYHSLARFAFKDVNVATNAFKKIPGVEECIIIQTSSRVEIFTVSNLETDDSADARKPEGKSLIINKIKETWKQNSGIEQIDIDHFDQTLEVFKDDDVYLHLLRLACGLDSIVVGKQDVYDEIRKSLEIAKKSGSSGKILNKLFDSVIRLANSIRDSTEISKEVLSLGDVALNLVEEKVGLDAKKKILLIGTGESAAMVAKALAQKQISFTVTSKTMERSTNFSQLLCGTPMEFVDVLSGFDKFDIVIVATTADYFLINLERIKLVMQEKKKGTLILDISEPRAVEETIMELPRLKLLFRDQVAEIYEENAKSISDIVPAVEKIIDIQLPILSASMKRV